MISKIKSCGLYGIDGYIVDVEADVSNGLPAFDVVGLPDIAVKESRERVRAAIKNSLLDFPLKRITINLAPAHIKKEGPIYDLPICIGILACTRQIKNNEIFDYMFLEAQDKEEENERLREENEDLRQQLNNRKTNIADSEEEEYDKARFFAEDVQSIARDC